MTNHLSPRKYSVKIGLGLSMVAFLMFGRIDASYALEIPSITKTIDTPITLRFREGKSTLCSGEYTTYDYANQKEEKVPYSTESGVYSKLKEGHFISILKIKEKYLLADYPLSADGLFSEKPPSIRTNLNQETEEYKSLEKEIKITHTLFRKGVYGIPIDSRAISFDAGNIPEDTCKKIGNSTPIEKSPVKIQAKGYTEHKGSTGVLLSLSQQMACKVDNYRIEIETAMSINVDISSGLSTMNSAVIEAFSGGRRLIKIQQQENCDIAPFPNPAIEKSVSQSDVLN